MYVMLFMYPVQTKHQATNPKLISLSHEIKDASIITTKMNVHLHQFIFFYFILTNSKCCICNSNICFI